MSYIKDRCHYTGCSKHRSFGYASDKVPRFCEEHKEPGMINVHSKKCVECGKQPSFGIKGGKATHCKTHKTKDMVKTRKGCKYGVCPKQNSFGFPGGKPEFCGEHKQDGMVNVIRKKCKYPKCPTRPSFALLGNSPEYCSKHKLKNMVDVCSRHCDYPGCDTTANFRFLNQVPSRCATHKEIGMINTHVCLCNYEGCDTEASFGIPGGKRIRCVTHKTNEMINIVRITCGYPECKKSAMFGYKEDGKLQFCATHRLENMVDVKSANCIYLCCDNRARYGRLFEHLTHCSKHRNANEFYEPNPICEHQPCSEKPFWSDTNYPKSCETHKQPEYKNIVEKPCACCGLTYLLKNDLCNDCDTFKQTKHKVKEARIGEVLRNNNINYYSADRIVQNGCSKHRPDYIVETPLFEIIVEVDEHQHKSYACECEIARMINIHQDFGGKPVMFIRYNPDPFKNHLGEDCRIPQTKRESALVNHIKKLMTRIKEWNTPLSVVYLFYDGHDGYLKCHEIDYLSQRINEVNLLTSK